VELAKLIAPFAPFVAEEMYGNLTQKAESRKQKWGGEMSVHLEGYPQADEGMVDEELMEEMRMVREIISEGLEIRAREAVKVRQPLKSLRVTGYGLQEEMKEIIKDELNVKEIVVKERGERKISLDTEITPELKREGQAREIVRMVQEMRKKAGYNVDDRIVLGYEGMGDVFEMFGESIVARETLADEVRAEKLPKYDAEKSLRLDGEDVRVWIRKK